MEIVDPKYRKTKGQVRAMVDNMGDDDITPEILLMIDYAYYNTDVDYEEGLSFLDRLHSALSMRFQLDWKLYNLKVTILESETPSVTFIDILNEILTPDMMAWYGL